MLWRFKQFLTLWLHLFTSGESKWSWVRKMIGALVFLGILRFTAWDISVVIAIETSPPLINVRLGLLIFIIVAIAWLLISAGRAYELAGVPDLWVANDLVEDQDVFRLRLMSRQKDFSTTVWLMEVFDDSGVPLLPGRFPLPLDWSHHSGASLVHLTKGIESSVSVARIVRGPSGLAVRLDCTGAQHAAKLQLLKGEGAYFRLRVEHGTRKPIERWFRFDRVDYGEWKASTSTPLTMPEATPATPKRVS